MRVPVYLNPESLIGPSFLWLCIPKNASQSIKQCVLDVGGTHVTEHLSSIEDRFTFAVLRDPLARVVSAWRNKVENPPDTPAQQKLMASSQGLRPGMSLDDFISWLGDWCFPSGNINVHWRPQSDFVLDGADRMCTDFLATMENLDGDMDFVSSWIGKKLILPKLNASPHSEKTPCSKHSRRVIAALYARDLDLIEDAGVS